MGIFVARTLDYPILFPVSFRDFQQGEAEKKVFADRMTHPTPLALRWILANGMTQLRPWRFFDSDQGESAERAYARESGSDSRVWVFACRQDCDDFAGFVVESGRITDRVVCFHPSFNGSIHTCLVNSEHENLFDFLRDVVLADTENWCGEDELDDLGK